MSNKSVDIGIPLKRETAGNELSKGSRLDGVEFDPDLGILKRKGSETLDLTTLGGRFSSSTQSSKLSAKRAGTVDYTWSPTKALMGSALREDSKASSMIALHTHMLNDAGNVDPRLANDHARKRIDAMMKSKYKSGKEYTQYMERYDGLMAHIEKNPKCLENIDAIPHTSQLVGQVGAGTKQTYGQLGKTGLNNSNRNIEQMNRSSQGASFSGAAPEQQNALLIKLLKMLLGLDDKKTGELAENLQKLDDSQKDKFAKNVLDPENAKIETRDKEALQNTGLSKEDVEAIAEAVMKRKDEAIADMNATKSQTENVIKDDQQKSENLTVDKDLEIQEKLDSLNDQIKSSGVGTQEQYREKEELENQLEAAKKAQEDKGTSVDPDKKGDIKQDGPQNPEQNNSQKTEKQKPAINLDNQTRKKQEREALRDANAKNQDSAMNLNTDSLTGPQEVSNATAETPKKTLGGQAFMADGVVPPKTNKQPVLPSSKNNNWAKKVTPETIKPAQDNLKEDADIQKRPERVKPAGPILEKQQQPKPKQQERRSSIGSKPSGMNSTAFSPNKVPNNRPKSTSTAPVKTPAQMKVAAQKSKRDRQIANSGNSSGKRFVKPKSAARA